MNSLQIQEMQFYAKFVDWWINIFIFSMLLSAFADFHNLFLFVNMRAKAVRHTLTSDSWSLCLVIFNTKLIIGHVMPEE